MKWYSRLYLGSGLEEKKDKLIKKIEQNAGTPGLYVLTLAANGRDLFDIFSTDMLLQPILHGHCPLIVGLATDKWEAVAMAEEIVMATFKETGAFDVSAYLMKQAGEHPIEEYPMEKLKRRRRAIFGKK